MPENIVRYAVESSLGYVWFVFMAIWGGTASYLSRLKKANGLFSIAELFGEWMISGFAGITTAYFCQSYGFDFYMTASLTGIAGHMGGRGIFIIENAIKNRVENWINGKKY